MYRMKHKNLVIGLVFAVGTFVVLSFFAGGVIEFSHEVGFLRWFSEYVLYILGNKLTYKFIAAFFVGGFVTFAASMISYGKAIKQNKVQRVNFEAREESKNSKIA